MSLVYSDSGNVTEYLTAVILSLWLFRLPFTFLVSHSAPEQREGEEPPHFLRSGTGLTPQTGILSLTARAGSCRK